MKKLILFLLLFPCLAHAGTRTKYYSPLGTVTISSSPIIPPDVIAFDSSTSAGGTGGSSPVTWNQTIGSGSHRFIAVGCGTTSGSTVTAVSVGGNSMTRSTSTVAPAPLGPVVSLWTLAAPPSGSQSIQATFVNGTDGRVICGAASFSGVKQTSTVDTSTASYNNPNNFTQTATWNTTVANDVLIDIVFDSSLNVLAADAGQVKLWEATSSGEGFAVAMSTKATTTAGSYTMGWTSIGNPAYQAAIAIQPGP